MPRSVSQAPAGASIFDLSVSASAGAGLQGNWQAVAAANGIENPRLLAPGQVIDLHAGITKK